MVRSKFDFHIRWWDKSGFSAYIKSGFGSMNRVSTRFKSKDVSEKTFLKENCKTLVSKEHRFNTQWGE